MFADADAKRDDGDLAVEDMREARPVPAGQTSDYLPRVQAFPPPAKRAKFPGINRAKPAESLSSSVPCSAPADASPL